MKISSNLDEVGDIDVVLELLMKNHIEGRVLAELGLREFTKSFNELANKSQIEAYTKAILIMLCKEGYVNTVNDKFMFGDTISDGTTIYYSISFDGLLLNGSGGYRKMLKDDEFLREGEILRRNKAEKNEKRIVWGTVVLAGLTLFWIILDLIRFYFDYSPAFCL